MSLAPQALRLGRFKPQKEFRLTGPKQAGPDQAVAATRWSL